jgi:cell division protein FtsB
MDDLTNLTDTQIAAKIHELKFQLNSWIGINHNAVYGRMGSHAFKQQQQQTAQFAKHVQELYNYRIALKQELKARKKAAERKRKLSIVFSDGDGTKPSQ